jgi:hypothetical protein
MRNLIQLTAAAALGLTPLAVHAQTDPAAAAAAQPRQPTPAELENLERGIQIMQSFMAALQSEGVPEVAKQQLFMCMYTQTMSRISAETGKAFDKNPQLDRTSQNETYRIAAGLCGVKLTAAAGNGAGGN